MRDLRAARTARRRPARARAVHAGPAGAGSAAVGTAREPRRSRWDDAGMATAEYAIATVAAAGFAGLLIAILRSDEVRGLLLGIVRGALSQ
ncbi:MAG: DUF4244 domain-containing protein [Actinotalea sp.]|nr:DUF4244 domain-containing protein [Actinotalea sp.]